MNCTLGSITLESSGKRRRVDLHVQVDGVDAAALGVMSQGELHCLALSLFIPRATLAESPFRFIVIDDPVQSMDPARVDGLARVLESAAKDRQVIVFTHDDRLAEAVRRLGINARAIEVTRREGSVVDLRVGKDPVSRNIEDAIAVAKTEGLPVVAAKRVIFGGPAPETTRTRLIERPRPFHHRDELRPSPERRRTGSDRNAQYTRASRDKCYDGFEAGPMAATQAGITDQELLKLPRDGRKYELVDGAVRVSPAGARHGQICIRLAIKLGSFVAEKKLGHVLDSSTGFRFRSGNVRSPDLSFVAAGRFADERPPVGFASLAPDLAVEVLSPEDSKRAILDKVGEYLEAGTRLVWVLDPQANKAAVYRSLTSIDQLEMDAFLDGEDVVPGFQCPLREILV